MNRKQKRNEVYVLMNLYYFIRSEHAFVFGELNSEGIGMFCLLMFTMKRDGCRKKVDIEKLW